MVPISSHVQPGSTNSRERHTSSVKNRSVARTARTADTIEAETPSETAEPVQAPVTEPEVAVAPPQSAPATSETCRTAIAKIWPAELQAGAITVLEHENTSENPEAIGPVNDDAAKSQDFGCFQINNHYHPGYFTQGNWKDPMWAAQFALSIYKVRQAATGKGWTAWYAVRGILW